MDTADVDKIINAAPEGWSVLAVAMPTRALRVIGENAGFKFRVEQLNPQNWTWRAVSSHAGDVQFESFIPAMNDMITKQARLKEKIKFADHERKMLQIKAQNPNIPDTLQ